MGKGQGIIKDGLVIAGARVPGWTCNYGLKLTHNSPDTNDVTITLYGGNDADLSPSNPAHFTFRSSTLTSAALVPIVATANITCVINSGSTLAINSSQASQHRVFIYLINDDGTLKLGFSNDILDEDQLHTSVDEGDGAADSGSVLYTDTSVSVASSKAIRLIGRMTDMTTQTPGDWGDSITEICTLPFQDIHQSYNTGNQNSRFNFCMFYTASGHGSTGTKVRTFSSINNSSIFAWGANDATNGAAITIQKTGLYAINVRDGNSVGVPMIGVAKNPVDLTDDIFGHAQELVSIKPQTGYLSNFCWVEELAAGDVLRLMDDGNCNETGNAAFGVTKIPNRLY